MTPPVTARQEDRSAAGQAVPERRAPRLEDGSYGEIVRILLQNRLITRRQVIYAVRVQSKLKSKPPLLDVLKQLNYITDVQIRDTIQANLVSLRIGDMLMELGLISEADLRAGLSLQAQEKNKRKLGEVLVANNLLDERELIATLALQLGFPFVEPEFSEIDEALFSRCPLNLYRQHHFIPIASEKGKILVAFADPLNAEHFEAARRHLKAEIKPAITSKRSIKAAIERLHPETRAEHIAAKPGDSVVDIVNHIIVQAVEADNVSDIHIEPMRDRLRVRFRMDGVLVPFKDYSLGLAPSLTSRIKVMCKADIAEKRRHQDGRILFERNGRRTDMRVSFYATVNGEKIVLRLLNQQNRLLQIDEICMSQRMLERFKEEALDRPSGVILITGPTGSGKTTTVYSCINHLNDPQTSIITAEEPVEYVIDGISQCSIDPKINLTYEETLRHVVRQDPDIIVIGEIRDSYSAGVAVQAAMTGHKVLTTFHTEDSIGGLLRLLNMEIDAFLISSTVVCVVAQRLLRRICPACKTAYEPTPTDLLRLGASPADLRGAAFARGKGCPECRHTGYRGRVAVFEILVLNEKVRDGLIQRHTSHQIRQVSIETAGLATLLEDGLYKAALGLTTIEEVIRCLPRMGKPRPLEELRRLLGDLKQ